MRSNFSNRRLLVTAIALAVCTGVGCDNGVDLTRLHPEGPPEVWEIFGTGPNGLLTLAYRKDLTPDNPDDEPLLPEWGTRPVGLTNATAFGGQKLRIIMDELLEGNTLEQFFCSCTYGTNGTDGVCPTGPRATTDPALCDEDPNTDLVDVGKFIDRNFDGLPDKAELQPGVATVTCGGFTWTYGDNVGDGGWYNPSGNQLPGVDGVNIIWDSLGPAVVLQPFVLPAGNNCTIGFPSTVVDKDGNPVDPSEFPPTIFSTRALALSSSSPSNNQTVSAAAGQILLNFNTLVDGASADAAISVNDGSVDLPLFNRVTAASGTVTVRGVGDTNLPLQPGLTYTVTITTALTDTFGVALAQPVSFVFHTN